MKSRIAVFIAAFVIWCLLGWVPDWQHALVGAVVAVIVAFIAGDMFAVRFDVLSYPKKFAAVLNYTVVFIWEMLKANIDVAYKVVRPGLPVSSGVVKVKTSLKSEAAIALLANSVTLASNTLTVDADAGTGYLYIHCMDIKEKGGNASVLKTVERFEKILKRFFE
ncbi:MAG: Na+/H+ antiporter subunit E [Candidatus Omnitrophota bacterium]|nr:Na+/H+ antiporter subunit E [Candidatus Omnitrophota bacterium]